MEMMVTSESTALMEIRIATRTGRPARKSLIASREGACRLLAMRPNTTKSRTGTPMVPNAPSGSRRKTLISIQVSFQSPRSIIVNPIREWSGQSA
jgi:ribosomal protein S6E (S10)